MIHRVMLCYGRLVSLRLANVLNKLSLKYMSNHLMLYVSHVMAKRVCVIALHENTHDVVSASAYRHSRIRICLF